MKTTVSATMMLVVWLALGVPVQASDQDRVIEASARNSYAFKTFLQRDAIEIRSDNGVVTLTGVVSKNIDQLLAQETVTALPGVNKVENRIEVRGATPDVTPDAILRDKVKRLLSFHRSVNSATTEVYVKDGIVTLRGVAASQAQKELTTEFIEDVDGVKTVVNELSVMVDETVDDASITAQVKVALLSNRALKAFISQVETKDGVVTLHGKAAGAQEFAKASRLTNDVNGVRGVKNWMTTE
ncbi:BON domain-containing protein [Geomesophilobacter sediminis]|uniref:BON domain-containing protein n=1 Tax=Geomesophilobacter sediminis TaxID=2798584 RepID=A0A8J7JFR1_9BACT|nr:BON domain-containing protein [Geomesophilobacter sediminis]MBJ6725229.1 BON domain-containing protein [Geomesophilobacter sediminis]